MSQIETLKTIDQSPKIVQQILQKVLAGDRGVNINIFIIYNNDGQFGSNGKGKMEFKVTPQIEKRSFLKRLFKKEETPKLLPEKVEAHQVGGIKYHFSKEALSKVLEQTEGNKRKAAQILGVPYYTVIQRSMKWGLTNSTKGE